MSLSRNEKMDMLLEQIQLDKETIEAHFKESQLERLEVDPKEKSGTFIFNWRICCLQLYIKSLLLS